MWEYISDIWQAIVESLESLKELDPAALIVSLVVSILTWMMMWFLPWWATISFKNKLIISIVAPFVFYVVAKIRLDKG